MGCSHGQCQDKTYLKHIINKNGPLFFVWIPPKSIENTCIWNAGNGAFYILLKHGLLLGKYVHTSNVTLKYTHSFIRSTFERFHAKRALMAWIIPLIYFWEPIYIRNIGIVCGKIEGRILCVGLLHLKQMIVLSVWMFWRNVFVQCDSHDFYHDKNCKISRGSGF